SRATRARPPPSPTPSPYTTLFRSAERGRDRGERRLVLPLAPRPVAMNVVVVRREALIGRQAGAQRQIGLGLGRGDRLAERREERSEEHTSELQSRENLVCRLLLEK